MRQAIEAVAAGQPPGAAFESVRHYLYSGGVGLLFAALDAVFPGDIPRIRVALACLNGLGMLGCFFLGRRLGRSFAGGLAGLAAAAAYPSFSVQTGRLFPEPVVGCLFVWSAVFFLKGIEDRRRRWLAASGFSLFLGLSSGHS